MKSHAGMTLSGQYDHSFGNIYPVYLKDRMRELRFPDSDPLLSAILREYEAACQTTVVATTAANSSETMRRKPWAGAG